MKKIILILILILASSLRLWQIGQVPISLDWDEVALGYNAYSLMLTGKDEYGTPFPIVLESFGDYKPALYTYLIIPFIPIFDLSPIAVRIPSALIGILAVLLAYFLTKELLKRTDIALISSFLLAISPWHIQFSRVGFEASVSMLLNLAGLLFFLKGLKKPQLLIISAICFALSLYTYQSEKLFIPLFLFILLIIYWKKIFALPKKIVFLAILIFIILSFPIANFTFTNQNGLARAKGVSFLSDKTSLLQDEIKLLEKDEKNHYLIGEIFDNRRVVYMKTVIQGYLAHFDLNWIFITGDSVNRHHAPQMALMYIFELPILLIGFYFLVFNKFLRIDKKTKLLLIMWILITPIPASFTSGLPHAVRTLNFLPSFQIITAIGLFISFIFISKIKYQIAKIHIKYLFFTLCFLFFIFNFLYYIIQYFVQQNYFYAKDWNYGYSELVEFLVPIHSKYKTIVVSNQGNLDQSYIFFLFYQKYDTRKYLAEGGTRVSGIERDGNKFLNYEFRRFNYYEEKDLPILLVGADQDFSEEFEVLKRIYFPDKSVAIRVVEKR